MVPEPRSSRAQENRETTKFGHRDTGPDHVILRDVLRRGPHLSSAQGAAPGAQRSDPAPDHRGRGLQRAYHRQRRRAQHRGRGRKEPHLRLLGTDGDLEGVGRHPTAVLSEWRELHGPEHGHRRRLGLLRERPTNPQRQGPADGHHHHVVLRRPAGRVVQDRVDDQPAPPRRERLLRLQKLRGPGAGGRGPGEGAGEDRRERRRGRQATRRVAS